MLAVVPAATLHGLAGPDHPGRGRRRARPARVHDRRTAGHGAPGGARARPRRHPQRRLRVPAAPDHDQPRAGGPAQGAARRSTWRWRSASCSGRSRCGPGPATVAFLGELSLTGEVRPVPGDPADGRRARRPGRSAGSSSPTPRSRRRAWSMGSIVTGVATLAEAAAAIRRRRPRRRAGRDAAGEHRGRPGRGAGRAGHRGRPLPVPDLAEVRGQARGATRARDRPRRRPRAAADRPARASARRCWRGRSPGLLPPLDDAAALSVTIVASAAGEGPITALRREPPFRAPHHTLSYAGMVGGGPALSPGEVTRADRGVLFLDELAEFDRDVLEALRQPLEEGRVDDRAGRSSDHVPGPVPAGGRDEPVSVRVRRLDARGPLPLSRRHRRALRTPRLGTAARPHRPVGHDAARPAGDARGRSRAGGVGRRRGADRGRPRPGRPSIQRRPERPLARSGAARGLPARRGRAAARRRPGRGRGRQRPRHGAAAPGRADDRGPGGIGGRSRPSTSTRPPGTTRRPRAATALAS